MVLLLGCSGAGDSELIDDTEVADTAPEPCTEGIEVGDCAPDFTLPDRYAQPFTLSSQRGKVALVDISAVW